MKTKGKVRACFPESAKIPENVSSLERSESYFELDKSIRKFPWGSAGLSCSVLRAEAAGSLPWLPALLLPISHRHSIHLFFLWDTMYLTSSPAQVICGSVVMIFNERLCPHTLGTIPVCSTPLEHNPGQQSRNRALIAHPVLTSLPSAWRARQNCHKHFCGGCDSGSPACLPMAEGTPAVP